MRIPVLISFAGFVLLIMATFCPILKLFYVVNWDVYDGSMPNGIVLLLVSLVGILGTVFNDVRIIRLAAILSLGLVTLILLVNVAENIYIIWLHQH